MGTSRTRKGRLRRLVLTLSILSFFMDSSAVATIFSLVEEPGAIPPFHFVSMINCDPALTLPNICSQSPYLWAVSMALTPYLLRLASSASRSSLSLNTRSLLIMAPPKMTLMPVIFCSGNGEWTMGMGRTVRMRKRKFCCLPAWTAYYIFNCAITNVLHNSETGSTVSTLVRTARPQTVDESRKPAGTSCRCRRATDSMQVA